MDPCEVTNVLLSKIKIVDPEHASKIMGYILIQDLSERDLQRLAFGSEILLQSVISKVKADLGLSSNMLSTFSAPSSPSPVLNPISRPNNISNPLSQASSRTTGNGSFPDFPTSSSPRPWAIPALRQNNSGNSSICPKSSPFLSYDSIRTGSAVVSPFTKNGDDIGGDCGNNSGDFPDKNQLDEYLSFLDDSISKGEDFVDASVQLGGVPVANGDSHLHRRRFSESDASFGAQDGGFTGGYRPCTYFARGFCKHGENCKFVHSDFGGDNPFEVNTPGAIVGSSGEMKELVMQPQQHEEIIRMKAAQQQQQQQQQRLAYNKYITFLLQQQYEHLRSGAAGAMAGDEFHKFGRFPSERNDSLATGMAEKASTPSRQIYLTFPADSSFRDEDVSNYFSTFGLVQDVRIPYQQKRMFGFVTFVHPETVKLILKRGNPHFICDSRVLVKPYKDKGKVPSRTQQLLERGTYSPISSPSGLDQGELYDSHIGPRMLYNTQEMMLRQKLEQAELQQAIELQGRRLANLQLPDARGDFFPPRHLCSLSVGAPISLSTHNSVNPAVIGSSNGKNQQVAEGSVNSLDATEMNIQHAVNIACLENNDNTNGKEGLYEWQESPVSNLEHFLPSNLHVSPTRSSGDQKEIS